MAPYRRVLVATDGGAAGRRAVAEAVAVARSSHGRVAGIYVVDEAACAVAPTDAPAASLEAARRRHGAAALAAVRRAAEAAGVPAETRLAVGAPAAEIARAAAEADLLVVGAGRGGLARLLAGSVADAVARRAPCPVLVVPGGAGPGGNLEG